MCHSQLTYAVFLNRLETLINHRDRTNPRFHSSTCLRAPWIGVIPLSHSFDRPRHNKRPEIGSPSNGTNRENMERTDFIVPVP